MSIHLSKNQFLKLIEKIAHTTEASLFLEEFQSIPKLQFGVVFIQPSALNTALSYIAKDLAVMNQLDIYPIVVVGNDPTVLIEQIGHYSGQAQMVPENMKMDRFHISQLIDQHITPIIYGDDPVKIAESIIHSIQPKKYIIITENDGIYDKNNNRLSFINISNHLESKIRPEFKSILQDIDRVLTVYSECAVVVTSAEKLLQEIFTIKGSGTFIKSHTILTANPTDPIDQLQLTDLLEDAFGKPLKKVYFEQPFDRMFIQKDYEGVAIIQTINGIPYLDKFAVRPMFQGTGLGKSLWEKVVVEYPSLVWRAAVNNPFNSFYLKECTGCLKYTDWHIFWRHLSLEEIIPIIPLVRSKSASF